MDGYAMYEVARERIAEQQRGARQAREARAQRAAARAARRAKKEALAAPVIPDFAHEMFDVARDAVPAPRHEAGRGRHAGTSH